MKKLIIVCSILTATIHAGKDTLSPEVRARIQKVSNDYDTLRAELKLREASFEREYEEKGPKGSIDSTKTGIEARIKQCPLSLPILIPIGCVVCYGVINWAHSTFQDNSR